MPELIVDSDLSRVALLGFTGKNWGSERSKGPRVLGGGCGGPGHKGFAGRYSVDAVELLNGGLSQFLWAVAPEGC